jgi:phage gpG-like protein
MALSRKSGKSSGKYREGLGVGITPDPAQFAEAMKRLGTDLADWRPAWIKVAPIVQAGIANNIRTQHDPYGTTWPPLEAKYARRKARAGYTSAALYRTGRLVASFLASGAVTMTPARLKVGTSLPYARAVNFGTVQGRNRGIAARPFMGITPEMRRASLGAMNARARELIALSILPAPKGGA